MSLGACMVERMFEREMKGIGSAVEDLLVVDVEGLDVDRLAGELVELERLSGLVEAARLQRLAVFEREGGHHSFGFSSPTAFLKFRCRMGGVRAHRLVHHAHTASTTPHVFSAWTDGRLSSDQVFQLFRTADRNPEQFGSAEDDLVDIMEDLSVSDTRRALEYWFQSVDGPGALDDEQKQSQRRGVSVSEGFDGMGRIDGDLTTLARETLHTALDALTGPPGTEDTRTPRQRRHDALEDLARYYLDHQTETTTGGEKPHVNLVCDLNALQGLAGGSHETMTGQVLTVTQIRTLACDSSVSRIVLGPASEIVDVGRRTRVIPTALRRGISIRDRQCTWRGGCDRTPPWCDIHHDLHWADGGETNPENCRLLCRYHHTLTHQLEEASLPPPRRWRRWRTPGQTQSAFNTASTHQTPLPELVRRD